MRSHYRLATAISNRAEFVERLKARDRTIVSDDPIHYPPEYDFLLNLDDGDRIRLRHYASPTGVASPILQLDLKPEPWGLTIECEFLNRNAPFSAKERQAAKELAAIGADEVAIAILGRLWRMLVWDLWLDSLFQRRAMARFGSSLLAFVKELAEEDGIVGSAVPPPGSDAAVSDPQ